MLVMANVMLFAIMQLTMCPYHVCRPMDQPDRPELLLSLVVRLTQDAAPSLAPLQAAIAAPLADLPQHWYFVPVEFARAMRSVVQVWSVLG